MNLQSAIANRKWTLTSLVAVSVFLFLLAPAAPERLTAAGWEDLAARTLSGAYHVHTTRSDGHGDKAAVAAAAARAGLKFVILTDHGDGTRPPDPPQYMHGVLMLDAVEISTDDGHYVALDMPQAPYPLGGAGEAVVEDVHRLGGFGVAAHPDSPKAALRWTEFAAPIDGIEWMNADSQWRDESRGRLVRAGLGYLFRPAGGLAMLLDRPATLDRWNDLLRRRPVVGLGASDAHGGPGQRVEDQSRTLLGTVGIPSYEASFREMAIRVVLAQAPGGDAAADGKAIFTAIRHGHVFTTIDALAGPGFVDLHAVPSGSSVSIIGRATLPRGAQLVLIGPQGEIARTAGEVRHEVPAATAAAYRVEVHLPGAPGEPPVPWLVSNPVYVGATPPAAATATSAPSRPDSAPGTPHAALRTPDSALRTPHSALRTPDSALRTPDSALRTPHAALRTPHSALRTAHSALRTIPPFPWRIEKDPSSSAILRTSDSSVELQYQLAPGGRKDQFVALATDVQGQAFGGVDLELAADRPSRVAVQVRAGDGRRWGRSFYVDPAGSLVHAALAAMRPVGQGTGAPPSTDAITSILLVVDLTNAAPGRSGSLVVRSSALVK